MAEPRLTVRPFDKTMHDRRSFSCGIPAMDRWLRESVADQIALNRLRLWCATNDQGALVGWYGLAMHAVSPLEATALARLRERHAIPAIYLVALAVDLAQQGAGIGAALLGDAIARSVALSDQIGAAAVVLDVLRDASFSRRREFYLAAGFAEIGNGDAGRLYLSIRDARAALDAVRS
jgi:GNAT superfamily N-acetyltransferase